MLYPASMKGPLKVGNHDPDCARIMGFILRPDIWSPATVYLKYDSDNYDVVIPSVYKGIYYKCVNPGKSHATTEPDWALTVGDTTDDFETGETEGLQWEAVAYTLMPMNETVVTVAYTCSNGVTVSNASNTGTKCQFMINEIAADATARILGYFDVMADITKSNGENINVTLRFKLAEH